MYRRGIVSELDPATGRARVEFQDRDGVASWWLNVNQPAASASKVYAMPDLGAQVNCLVDKNAEEGCILGALYSDEDRPPITDPRHQHGALEGGLVFDYDRDTGALTISMPADMAVTAVNIQITGNVSIKGDLTVDGSVTAKGGNLTHEGVNVGKDHRHRDTQVGIGMSGPPQA